MEKFKSLPAATRSTIITYAMVVIAFLIMQGLLSVGAVSNSTQGLLVPICAYICMAISLNLVVGISGELSLGHAGFMSVGAFTGVVVSTVLAGSGTSGPVRLLVAIVAAGVSAAIAGLLIGSPVMRLRGDYLAIVTLAFGEIIKNLLNNLYVGLDVRGLHFSMSDAASLGMDGGRVLINGPQGAIGYDSLSTFTAGFLLILFTLFVVLNLVNSRSG
ncbi:MAG: branched-chain amino acid ABC transporter permease, partial [Atopobiaceae bacterium]|nr:branched-chain amino acid ABC transporter permease [Atopobiaceae bacterium]